MSFDKILIANRGEIACRVIASAQALGYRTVAVYSEADRDARHVRLADEALCIGPANATASYLNIGALLDACRRSGADAVHPGYGFLSENSDFARACEDAGITFIGPPVAAIRLMGSKRLSKIAMEEAGVPCVPGYQGEDQSDDTLLREARRIGLPLMIKASAGGGGRGMRVVTDETEIPAQLNSARQEARNSFGNDELILERAVSTPRHVEIQVFGDHHGNVIHLGERDCSVQRRHQKVVEEAPSPALDATLRRRMGEAAVNAARACGYVGAGTVEFLLGADGEFYFLEMNTRLQVEHPVTELVTGQDLVAWQLKVAAGEALPLTQDQVTLTGHAMEVRLYAEDPAQGYLPQTGPVRRWRPASGEGIRVDHGLREGDQVWAATTTRCWPRSSPTAPPGRKPGAGCCARWKTPCSPASMTTVPSWPPSCATRCSPPVKPPPPLLAPISPATPVSRPHNPVMPCGRWRRCCSPGTRITAGTGQAAAGSPAPWARSL